MNSSIKDILKHAAAFIGGLVGGLIHVGGLVVGALIMREAVRQVAG